MGFGPLRVINDDRVTAGAGLPRIRTATWKSFPMWSRADSSTGQHRHRSVIRPGDVQRMSAGTGVRHSEYNSSKRSLSTSCKSGSSREAMASRRATSRRRSPPPTRGGDLRLVEYALRARRLGHHPSGRRPLRDPARPGDALSHRMAAGRVAWIQVVDGGLSVNGETLRSGDGVSISGAEELRLEALAGAHALVFDMAP